MRKKTYPLYKLTILDKGPTYDYVRGFVIRAADEVQARHIAARHACDEGEDAWLFIERSTCDVIGRSIATTEECGVILRDFNAG